MSILREEALDFSFVSHSFEEVGFSNSSRIVTSVFSQKPTLATTAATSYIYSI
jgi:hypothetical protein